MILKVILEPAKDAVDEGELIKDAIFMVQLVHHSGAYTKAVQYNLYGN